MKTKNLVLIIIIAIVSVIIIAGGIGFYLSKQLTEETQNPSTETTNGETQNDSTETFKNETALETSESQTYNVELKNFAFSPQILTIKVGDSVIWTNKDLVTHTVTSDSGDELNSGSLRNGESYTHTFDIIGSYEYHCIPHSSMKGKVIVG